MSAPLCCQLQHRHRHQHQQSSTHPPCHNNELLLRERLNDLALRDSEIQRTLRLAEYYLGFYGLLSNKLLASLTATLTKMSASSGKDTRERRNKKEVNLQMKMESKKTERNVYERYTDCTKGPITFDNIWKEVVSLERKLQREWWKRYGHLSGEMLKQILAEECVRAGLPVDTFERKPPEDLIKKSPIPLKPSPPVPNTSSARIGWRSSLKECNLEFTGPMYISAKRTIEPPLEPGEFRISQQKFIYLG